MATYVALQNADLELLERLAGLVAVADILKGLGGVLAADVEKDLLTTTVVEGCVSTCNVSRILADAGNGGRGGMARGR